MDTASSINLDEIARFVIKNGKGLYTQLNYTAIKNFVERHIAYKTIIVVEIVRV